MKKIVLGLMALLLLSACAAPVIPTATVEPSATPRPPATLAPTPMPILTSTATGTPCAQSEAYSAATALAKSIDSFATVSNNAIQSAVAVTDTRKDYRDSAGLILDETKKLSVSECARPAYEATLAYMQNTLDLIDAISPAGALANKEIWLAKNEAANAAMKTEIKALATMAGISLDSLTP